MSTHIIIDGYNLIRQSRHLSTQENLSLDLGRSALLEKLREYKKTRKHRITVVFDGAGKGGHHEHTETVSGMRVMYSRGGQSADMVIKLLVQREREGAVVVTADRELSGIVRSFGATVISSADFERKMTQALEEWAVSAMEHDDAIQPSRESGRKKGPSHRAPRTARRARQKLDKL